MDIFSFAIFVFELLSGCRPFREYRNVVDIKKAIRRGVRPSLESCDLDTQLPRLEGLMRQELILLYFVTSLMFLGGFFVHLLSHSKLLEVIILVPKGQMINLPEKEALSLQ